jgi:hypothetical protein
LPGGSTSYTASVASAAGFTGTVSFGVSGLPPGATATFSPSTLKDSGTTRLDATAGLMTPLGTYQLTITADGDGIVHRDSVTLLVGLSSSPAMLQ